MDSDESGQLSDGGSNALVRGALLGLVVAFAGLIIVGLIEPSEIGVAEAIGAFTLPLAGAVTSRVAWGRERRAGR